MTPIWLCAIDGGSIETATMNFFTRIDPAKNVARFWLSIVTPTLLGGWALVREWERIGSPGRMESRTFDHEDEARRAEQCRIKKR